MCPVYFCPIQSLLVWDVECCSYTSLPLHGLVCTVLFKSSGFLMNFGPKSNFVTKFARQLLFGFFWNFSHVTIRGTLYLKSMTSQKMLASNSFSSIPNKCVENNVENMYIGGRIFRVKKLSVFKTLAPFQITHLGTNSHIKCLRMHLIL